MANRVDYFEIGSPDPQASQAFYGGLFGWQFGDSSPAAYQMINGMEGGLWDSSGQGDQHWAIFYVHVDNVQASLDQAVALGAKVAVPFVDNGRIQFAHLIDPDGNRFAIWKPLASPVE